MFYLHFSKFIIANQHLTKKKKKIKADYKAPESVGGSEIIMCEGRRNVGARN